MIYDWPGNMRQLENVLYRSLKRMQIDNSTILKSRHIEELINKTSVQIKRDYNGVKYDHLIKEYLQYVFSKSNENQTKAAEMAGVSRLKMRAELIQCGIFQPKRIAKKINKENKGGKEQEVDQ
jgi:transcriptional regulator with PAS, ATPase and Fis domain